MLVQMTVTPWNYHEIGGVISFASDLGATGFTLYFLVCTGRGEALTDITPRQYEEALASLLEAQREYPNMVLRARCAPQIYRLAYGKGSTLTGSAGCLAGTVYGRITPEGEVTPCPYLPIVVGNVRDTGLAELWAGSPVLHQLRDPNLGGRCGICEFRQQCGGCRARVYAVKGDLWAEDPFCDYQPTGSFSSQVAAIAWEEEAEARIQRVPGFIRGRVKGAVEEFARSRGHATVSLEVIEEVLRSVRPQLPPYVKH